MAKPKVELYNSFDEWRIITNILSDEIGDMVLITPDCELTSGTTWSSNVVTFKTATPHLFQVGNSITISGVVPAGYNGTFTIVSSANTTTFTAELLSNPGSWVSGGTAAKVISNELDVRDKLNDLYAKKYNRFGGAITGWTTISSTLGVTGATTLSNTAEVTGNFSVNTNKFNVTAASGNTTIAGTLGVASDVAVNTNKFNVTATSGNTTIAGTLGVTGDIAVNTNKFNVTATSGNTTIAGTLGVTGATTLSSTLGVTGATTLSSTLSVASNIAVNTNKFNITAASGNTTIAGTLGVTGASTFTSGQFSTTLGVTGATTLSSTLGVTGATTLSSTLGVAGDVAVNTNKFNIAALTGDIAINVNKFTVLGASGNTTIAGTLDVTGASTFTSGQFSTTLGVTGATTLSSTLGVTGASTFTSGQFSTTLGVTGATTLSSTLGVTGASTFTSGQFSTTLGVTGATTLSSTLGVTGASTFTSGQFSTTLGVTGATTLSSTLGVTGASTFTSGQFSTTLGVTGATTLSSTLGVTGNVTVNTNKFIITAATGATSIAGDVAIGSNKLTVAAATGNTVIAGTLNVSGLVTLTTQLGLESGGTGLNITALGSNKILGSTGAGAAYEMKALTSANSSISITYPSAGVINLETSATLGATTFSGDLIVGVPTKAIVAASTGNITSSGSVSIGDATSIGGAAVGGVATFITSFLITTTITAAQVVMSLPSSTYRSAEYLIQAVSSTAPARFQITKILAIHDGTNVMYTEYASSDSGGLCGAYSVDISTGNLRLLVTPAVINSTTFKCSVHAIKV